MLLSRQGVEVPMATIARLRALYDEGFLLQAYELAKPLTPWANWTGTAARLIGGRLAINLGAPRLCRWLHLHAWRDDPDNLECCYYRARQVLERNGPLAAWEFLQAAGDHPEAEPETRGDWFALHASVFVRLRDFDAAEQWLARADQVAPNRPWINIERSALLEAQDRYPEALAAAQQTLAARPWYRPGVQRVAHTLLLLDREQCALELLTEANQRIESGAVAAQLAGLQTEMGHFADARRTYKRFAELSPLLEKALLPWLASKRADAAYFDGDFAQAAKYAKEIEEPFYTDLAKRLEELPDNGRRVLLPVGFVRQHHLTCAPATLAALARYWEMPADHLEVAAEICYDGTPDHSERHWAETHGWLAREFTVTWDCAVALLDRGIPFTFTIVEPTFSHLQAVIGYDSRRGTLLIRDPFERHFGEGVAKPLLERYQAYGPRGMVLVPLAKADRLDGIELPDAALYDHLYKLRRAVYLHDRETAQLAYEAMYATAANHRLTWHARWDLARYDGNAVEGLACANGLLDLYPDTAPLQLAKLSLLRDQMHREERLQFLRDLYAKPFPHPAFRLQYAQALRDDARQHGNAIRIMRRSLRFQPGHAPAYFVLGNLLYDQRRHAEATQLYRFAACLDDRDEQFAQTYFNTARLLHQTEAALRYLQNRFQRFGKNSSQPARTLYWAYSDQERMPEAFAVLDEARRLRPDDGDLARITAEEHGRHGRFVDAEELLAQAEGKCAPALWLRTAATLARWQGQRAQALDRWRQVLASEPLALDAHRNTAHLLAEMEGRPAGLEHLANACTRFPHHIGLHELWIQWLRDEGAAAVEPAVRRLLAMHPTNAWAHRELADAVGRQGHFDEAFAALARARELEPMAGAYYNIRGEVLTLAGKFAAAKETFRDGVRMSVDNDFAIAQWVELCDTLSERRAALDFIQQELLRQVSFGDGLLAFRHHAKETLASAELLAILRNAWQQRPDLWHAWSALIRELIDDKQLDEAHSLAQQAVQRFPLLPRIWLDRALVCKARKERDEEIAALEQALHISPGWSTALRLLAEVHERDENHAEARKWLELAVARAPLEAGNHGYLADTLWALGEKDAALERLCHALRIEPDYDWAWTHLREWCEDLDRPADATAFAQEMIERRPGEARPWLELARCLIREKENLKAVAMLDRVLELQPHHADARDLKADLLTREKKYDEALAACRFGDNGAGPLFLRGRAAWIEAERGDLPKAVETMRAVLEEDRNYYWGWKNLAEWLNEQKNYPEYLKAAEELVRLGAPDNPVPFGLLGEAKLLCNDRAGGIEALRTAMAIDPEYGYAGMTLFDAQLADGELEEAAKTLAELRDHVGGPFVVGRAMQLAAKRKDEKALIAGLGELAGGQDTWPYEVALEAAFKFPAIAGGPEYRRAVEEFVRACGDDHPSPHGYHAEFLLHVKDRPAAKAALRKALEIDQAYSYGAANLFDEQLADNELDEAAKSLSLLQEHRYDQNTAARTIQLAARRKDKKAALDALAKLCQMTFDYNWPFDTALAAMTKARWGNDAERVMWQALAAKDVPPRVARNWAQHCCTLGRFNLRKEIDELLFRNQLGAEALAGFVEGLRKAENAASLKWCVKYYRGSLRVANESWGDVGYALLCVNDYAGATRWLADWEGRADVQPWMLLNLAVALRALKRDAEARRVSEFAVNLPKPDHSVSSHQLWLALDDALADKPQAVADRLASVRDADEADYYRLLESVIGCWLELRQAPAANWHQEYATARRKMGDALAEYRKKGKTITGTLRRTQRRLAWRMARMQGGLLAGVWRYLLAMS